MVLPWSGRAARGRRYDGVVNVENRLHMANHTTSRTTAAPAALEAVADEVFRRYGRAWKPQNETGSARPSRDDLQPAGRTSIQPGDGPLAGLVPILVDRVYVGQQQQQVSLDPLCQQRRCEVLVDDAFEALDGACGCPRYGDPTTTGADRDDARPKQGLDGLELQDRRARRARPPRRSCGRAVGGTAGPPARLGWLTGPHRPSQRRRYRRAAGSSSPGDGLSRRRSDAASRLCGAYHHPLEPLHKLDVLTFDLENDTAVSDAESVMGPISARLRKSPHPSVHRRSGAECGTCRVERFRRRTPSRRLRIGTCNAMTGWRGI